MPIGREGEEEYLGRRQPIGYTLDLQAPRVAGGFLIDRPDEQVLPSRRVSGQAHDRETRAWRRTDRPGATYGDRGGDRRMVVGLRLVRAVLRRGVADEHKERGHD